MTQTQEKDHWLSRYASTQHVWKLSTAPDGKQAFTRPLGLVETSFDVDGTYFGGRADMTGLFTLAIKHKLTKQELRRRIALSWTNLRLQHVLLMSRVVESAGGSGKTNFAIDIPGSTEDAVKAVEESIVWIEDLYDDEEIDELTLYHHAYNVSRIIQPQKCLSRLFVLPLKLQPDGTYSLRFLIVIAHQISDGLSAYNWFSHWIKILNHPGTTIETDISRLISAASIQQKLPPAQEDLYPKMTGNKARQRWFWALIRVLRHVKQALPPTFTNPLYRAERLSKPLKLEPTFTKLFNYDAATQPPNSCGYISTALSPSASARLIELCRTSRLSVGAGCFALAGLSLMEMHEALYPDVSDAARPAFTASFPLNPRAFFANPPQADSCMLAFSEGIVMPFLPKRLGVEGRFRLCARQANRGLRVYQKRLKGKESGEGVGGGGLDMYSPIRLLATGYLAQIERVEAKLPPERRSGGVDPQGALKPRVGQYGATCGVSSVGSLASFFKRGEYNLEDMGGKDLAADFRNVRIGVRARENEFLVGSSTNAEGIVGFGVSYDMNAISQEAAEKWAETISGLLEKGDGSRL